MDRQPRRQEPRFVSGAEGGADPPIYAPEGLAEGIPILAVEPVFAEILQRAGPPRFRRRRNGFGTLLHIILEQQVSIDAAAAMHKRLLGACHPLVPETFLALDDSTLRSCGFSRWSAEIYLLFALGRPDIWPAGDLGLQVAMGDHMGSGARPDEVEMRRIGELWRPWRSVAACLFWQSYLHARGRTAPRLSPELYA